MLGRVPGFFLAIFFLVAGAHLFSPCLFVSEPWDSAPKVIIYSYELQPGAKKKKN